MASSSALFLPLLLRTDSTLDSRVLSTVRARQYDTTMQQFSWLGLFACFLYEDLGPKTLSIALLLLPLGYIGLGLTGVGVGKGDNLIGKGALVAMTGQGSCIASVVPLLCLMDLFPADHSRVMGLLAGTHSISLLLYYSTAKLLHLELEQLYVTPTQLVVAGIALALLFAAVIVFCVLQLQPTPDAEQTKERRIVTRLCLVALGVGWICVSTLLCRDNLPAKILFVVFGWVSPSLYLISLYFNRKFPVYISFGSEENERILPQADSIPLLQAMKRNSFWLIFFTTAVIVGTGCTLRNNLFDILQHIDVAVKWNPDSYYLLMTVVEAAAGLGAGVVADKVQPRLVLCVLCFLSSAAMFMLYMGLHFSFLIGVLVTGLTLGALATLMPVMVYEEFGPVQFSRKYGFMLLANSTGAIILSTAISSHAYFVHIGGERAKSCEGADCFSVSFAINCAATCLAAMAMLALAHDRRWERTVDPAESAKTSSEVAH